MPDAGELSELSELSGIRLLLVDDEACVRDAYRRLLGGHGATVMTAESGNTGWRHFRDSRPDVVISDVHMSDGSGYELVRRIRALSAEEGGLTPAIATSGDCSETESLEAGFHAHLVKPADVRELIHLVRSFVHEGSDSRSSWTLSESPPDIAMLTFVGHPTADDMRAATIALAKLLETGSRHVVVDLRKVSGFDLSIGSVAERTTWRVRNRIIDATIIGGSLLARLIAKTACVTLGTPCSFVHL